MVYLVHLAGCAYYGFSKIEGIGSTRKINIYLNIIYEAIFYIILQPVALNSNHFLFAFI